MKNAREHAEQFNSLFVGMRTDGEHGIQLLEQLAKSVALDVMAECQAIAKKVAASPRTEILNIQPGDAKVMTPHDCWVRASQAIDRRIEIMKGAQ